MVMMSLMVRMSVRFIRFVPFHVIFVYYIYFIIFYAENQDVFCISGKILRKITKNIFAKPIAKSFGLWYNNNVVNKCWCGSMAEQRYRKPQVRGSIPPVGTIDDIPLPGFGSGFLFCTCNECVWLNCPVPFATIQGGAFLFPFIASRSPMRLLSRLPVLANIMVKSKGDLA